MERPTVWKMVVEAVDALNGKATYTEIKNYIHSRWEPVNDNTINAALIILAVNQPSRIHYPENRKPRLSDSQYDVLYSTGRGQVVRYNPEEHGTWEIYENEFGALAIRQVISEAEELEDDQPAAPDTFHFPIEANLRDFLIKNLHTVKAHQLRLFQDETGRDGKEYPTGVGPIDILTTDENGDFVVFELKLSRGMDRALGQLLRYMGWVKANLAHGKQVRGIIVANKMDEKLKYAVTITPDVSLYEYEMKFDLTKL
ncbi:endonuclease NucS domain-containing protein [Pontibacter sp. H259]|uniref:endonuclease NucS domain-containing protein n=1 Tax=Pontibacter sp. H259 TaxID=3133421 RepID=UPI0030C3074E